MAIEGIEVGVMSNARVNRMNNTSKAQNVSGNNGYESSTQTVTQRPATAVANNNQSEDRQYSGDTYNDKGLQNVSPEKVEAALKDVNQKIKPTHTECQFSYHEETNRISIKIIDQNTGDVIKEIPPEKTLDMIAKAWEMAGILVDEKR